MECGGKVAASCQPSGILVQILIAVSSSVLFCHDKSRSPVGDPETRVAVDSVLQMALRDQVLEFRIGHPDLFGDSPLQPPPDIDSGTPQEAAKNYLDTLEPDKAWQVIAAHPGDFLDDPSALQPLTAQIADQNLAPRLLPLLEERAKRRPENWE